MAFVIKLVVMMCVLQMSPLVSADDDNMTSIICPKECMDGPGEGHFECVDSECIGFPTELISQPISVEFIDVSFNLITAVPMMSFPELTYLDLSHNHIKDIDVKAFDGCPKLKYLNISVNYIVELTRDISWYAEELVFFDLSDNRISKIDENVFRKMDRIVHLNLSSNNIDSISINTFFGLDDLEILSLSNNRLTEIHSDHFLSLNNLQYLSLRKNNIKYIEADAFQDVRDCLLRLDLGENKIINISTDMFHMAATHPFSTIQAIHLDNNLITEIPEGTFSPIVSLEYIFLDNNPIKTISNQRQFPEKAKKISLKENMKLHAITNGTFSGLTNLESVDISGCYRLSTIEAGAFDDKDSTVKEFRAAQAGLGTLSPNLLNWTRVRDIDLTGNPWICDCNLQWMQSTFPPDVIHSVICTYPHHLKGLALDTLEPDALECTFFSRYRHRMGLALIGAATIVFVVASTYLLITNQGRIFGPCKRKNKGDYQTLYTASDDTNDPAVAIQWDEAESEKASLKHNPAPTPV